MTAAALDHLHAAGIRVTVDGDRLTAGPRDRLTDELRDLIRQHKAVLVAMLRGTAVDLRDLAPTSLRLGTLVICNGCQHFEARPGERPDGWCQRYNCDSWARAPFECAAWCRA